MQYSSFQYIYPALLTCQALRLYPAHVWVNDQSAYDFTIFDLDIILSRYKLMKEIFSELKINVPKIEVLNKERIFTYWRSYKVNVNDGIIEIKGKKKIKKG